MARFSLAHCRPGQRITAAGGNHGERNWDYRYTWVRDASLTMEALWVAACPDEASKFFAFLADAAGSVGDLVASSYRR
jgi:GH15 family glucan-1,4-alpha-glucosidase